MILKDISLDSPEENILLDEALFVAAEKFSGGEVLRFWESATPFVVLGRIGKAGDDVNAQAVRRDQIPVLRRTSGGGTVVQGKGCLNYTLVLNMDRDPAVSDLRRSYQWISQKVIDALGKQGIEAVFRPISDIALASGEKKFSGNAQRRGKQFILHHGTILYDFDLGLISKYLQMPKDIPEYRRRRTHDDFVANIPVQPQLFKQALAASFSARPADPVLTAKERELIASLGEKGMIQVDVDPS
jgi:lipoate-protein ligase A